MYSFFFFNPLRAIFIRTHTPQEIFKMFHKMFSFHFHLLCVMYFTVPWNNLIVLTESPGLRPVTVEILDFSNPFHSYNALCCNKWFKSHNEAYSTLFSKRFGANGYMKIALGLLIDRFYKTSTLTMIKLI